MPKDADDVALVIELELTGVGQNVFEVNLLTISAGG
jgi:hypothetical protein